MDMEDDWYLRFRSASAFKLRYLPSQMDVQFAILDTFRIFSTLLDVLPLLILMMLSSVVTDPVIDRSVKGSSQRGQ